MTKNKKRKSNVTGVIIPVITPVDEFENVDEKAYRAVMKHCINAGVDGIFAGGSAGMGPLLSDNQWRRAMEIARDEIDDNNILLGGVIATSSKRAVEQITFLESIGFLYAAVTPTFYITISTVDEMLSHFYACRNAVDMEMVVYNIPGCTNSVIPLEAMEKMAEDNWMTAIKESSGSRDYFKSLMEIASGFGLNVMQGNEPDIEWGLEIGASGIVPVCGNYEPATFVSAVLAASRGEKQNLSRIQERINQIREVLLMGDKNWIAGIMYGMKTLGIGSGNAVGPIQELSLEEKKRIEELKKIIPSDGNQSQITQRNIKTVSRPNYTTTGHENIFSNDNRT